MIARTIAEAEADLLANPRPVLFLDTCDLVNLLQVILPTMHVSELTGALRLLKELTNKPHCCQPIITFVISREFRQKTDPTDPVYQMDHGNKRLPTDEVAKQIQNLDTFIQRIHLVRQILKPALPAPAITYANLNLITDLVAVVSLLTDCCWEIQRDAASVDAAIERVLGKERPSHKQHIKDSLHLDHCLALASNLRQKGFSPPIVFISANKDDYGPAVGTQPHPDLQPAFAAVGMMYFEKINAGLVHLGI